MRILLYNLRVWSMNVFLWDLLVVFNRQVMIYFHNCLIYIEKNLNWFKHIDISIYPFLQVCRLSYLIYLHHSLQFNDI